MAFASIVDWHKWYLLSTQDIKIPLAKPPTFCTAGRSCSYLEPGPSPHTCGAMGRSEGNYLSESQIIIELKRNKGR